VIRLGCIAAKDFAQRLAHLSAQCRRGNDFNLLTEAQQFTHREIADSTGMVQWIQPCLSGRLAVLTTAAST
jgi:hypothetical protein